MARFMILALVAVVGACLAGPAEAWDSKCKISPTTECSALEAARTRWLVGKEDDEFGGGSEHARIWQETAAVAGLPEGLRCDGDPSSCELVLPIFTLQTKVRDETRGVDRDTLIPRPFEPPPAGEFEASHQRRIGLDELTELPDFSYSLSDWGQGNERCPDGSTETHICHDFKLHMGPLNSNHFVPQAELFYNHYHGLALGQAARCAVLKAAVLDPARGGPESPSNRYRISASGHAEGRLAEFLLDCEKTALAYEAVGQHFLQDAWSSGHMWERWGSPTDGVHPIVNLRLVALASGMIHGSRSELVKNLPPWAPRHDAMCSADLGVSWRQDGDPVAGIGDLYWDSFESVAALEPVTEQRIDDETIERPGSFATWAPGLALQKQQLIDCAATSILEVYARSGQIHGPLGAAAGFSTVPAEEFPEMCFAQRVTNRALWFGAQGPLNLRANLDGEPAASIFRNLTRIAVATPEGLSDERRDQFRTEAAATWGWFRWWALENPDGTEVASGFPGDLDRDGDDDMDDEKLRIFYRSQVRLMGVGLNSDYAGSPEATPYVDRNPFSSDRENERVLRHAFNRGNADLLCTPGGLEALDQGALESLKERVAELKQIVEDGGGDAAAALAALPAAREACVEVARRHVQVEYAGSILPERQPLCFFAASSPALIQEPGTSIEAAETLAERWCGAGGLEIAVQTGDLGGPFDQSFASFDSKVSVNSMGRIAFAGSNADFASSGFVTSVEGTPGNTTRVTFPDTDCCNFSSRRFAGAAIDNSEPPWAAFRELVPGAPATYLMRRWTQSSPGLTLVGRSSGIIGGLCSGGSRAGQVCFLSNDCPIFGLGTLSFAACLLGPSAPFDSASFWLDMNDEGVVTFVAQVDDSSRRAVFAGRDESDLQEMLTFSQFSSPLIRPQISNTNEIVFRDELGSIDVIEFPSGSLETVAAAPDFEAIGDRPGISADGQFVAFTASTESLPGIFLLRRGAGGGNWEVVGTEGDPGTPEGAFTAFGSSARYAVATSASAQTGTTIVTLVFAATRTSTPIETGVAESHEGVYRMSMTVDESDQLVVVEPPRAVVQAGEVLPLNGKEIAAFDLWDPLSDNGLYTAFWVLFTDGTQAILRQTGHPSVSGAAAVSSDLGCGLGFELALLLPPLLWLRRRRGQQAAFMG